MTRGTRLDKSGWQPDDNAKEFAKSYGLDPDAIWAEFQDYWTSRSGAGATKCDWLATWRNWCRRASNNPRGRQNWQKSQTADSHFIGSPEVMVGGRVFKYRELSKIRQALRQGWPIYDPEWSAFKKWQEMGNWTDIKLPNKPAVLPTEAEKDELLAELQAQGKLK